MGEAATFSPDGKNVLVLNGGHSIRFLDASTGSTSVEIHPSDDESQRWNDLSLAAQAHTLVIGGIDKQKRGGVEVWDFNGITPRASLQNADSEKVAAADENSKRAIERRDALHADLKKFQLDLQYNGAQDKPYYRLRLSVLPPAAGDRDNPFDLHAQITKAQAGKIIDYLAANRFLGTAYSLHDWQFIPKGSEPGYTLTVMDFYGDLGWKLPMLSQLGGLKSALEGNAANKMDTLLGRLSDERDQWLQETRRLEENGSVEDAAVPATAPSVEAHRDVLKAELAQARAESAERERAFQAGLDDVLTYQASKDRVQVLEAELTGDPKKVAEAKLAGARRRLDLASKQFSAGLSSPLELVKARSEVEICEAELTGDPVKAAEARLVCARRELEEDSRFLAMGLMTSADLAKAKGEVAVAEAKLREAKVQAEHPAPNGN